jgi:hypothetical protein
MVEVKAFRKLLYEWLIGITGMSALIGTRVSTPWPKKTETKPFIAYFLNRDHVGDDPVGNWDIRLDIFIVADTIAELDNIEDLINGSLDEGSVPALLTNADVKCTTITTGENVDDKREFDAATESYIFTTRQLRIEGAFVTLNG